MNIRREQIIENIWLFMKWKEGFRNEKETLRGDESDSQ